ncbi:MAG: zf-HC2 domain-containing protein, partial [Planctomycetota bacterium]|nr:zf-HC2 domain-containing protein [Planctomycetota bacterium]
SSDRASPGGSAMECGRMDELMESYVDRRLPPDLSAEVNGHLRSCDSCRRKVEAAAKSLGMIRDALGWVTPGEEFDSKITRRVIELPPPSRHAAAVRDGSAAAAGGYAGPDGIAAESGGPGRSRLIALAAGAAILFALAVLAIIWCLRRNP